MSRANILKHLIAAGLIAAITSSHAEDLVGVFKQAVESDPTFQEAEASMLSVGQNVPIARSFLLPQLTTSAQAAYNWQENRTRPLTRIPGIPRRQSFDFDSQEYSINLFQSVFDYSLWAQLSVNKSSAKAAAATYAASAQDLMARVATAYFNELFAEDNLRFIVAEKRAVYQQLDQVTQQYKVGLVAITGVYQAQAQYDLIVADEIAAKNDIVNAREDLRAITGVYYNDLNGLKPEIPLVKPTPADVEQWVATAMEQNWSLKSAEFTSDAAKENISVQRAGHYPTLGAFGNHSRNFTGTTPGGKIDNQLTVVGVELDFPIYQGGLVVSETKQAEYDYQGSRDSQEKTRRDVLNNTHQSYNNIIAGISKIKADKQAIVSNESSLKSTIESYKVGTQTMLDVLKAQQDLFDAERIFSRDRYTYINAIIALKQAAGTLNIRDLEEINTWLTTSKQAYSAIQMKRLEQDFAPNFDTDNTQDLITPNLPDTNDTPIIDPVEPPADLPGDDDINVEPEDPDTLKVSSLSQHLAHPAKKLMSFFKAKK